jgi:hypothetical protein
MSHGIIKCKNCTKTILQCRCPGPHTIKYELCEDCKKEIDKDAEEAAEVLRDMLGW